MDFCPKCGSMDVEVRSSNSGLINRETYDVMDEKKKICFCHSCGYVAVVKSIEFFVRVK